MLPPPLSSGVRIGIAAPGGPVRSDALESGVSYLEARGFRPVLGKNLGRRHAYLAGTDREGFTISTRSWPIRRFGRSGAPAAGTGAPPSRALSTPSPRAGGPGRP